MGFRFGYALTNETLGNSKATLSTSDAINFKPPTLIISLIRPTTLYSPFRSSTTSLVSYQPSESKGDGALRYPSIRLGERICRTLFETLVSTPPPPIFMNRLSLASDLTLKIPSSDIPNVCRKSTWGSNLHSSSSVG